MNTKTIVWLDTSGNMVPHYGTPKKGDVLIMDAKKAKSFIERKMAKEYSPASKKEG